MFHEIYPSVVHFHVIPKLVKQAEMYTSVEMHPQNKKNS